jgi:hypothetical protein
MSRADGSYVRDFPFVPATRSSLPPGPMTISELKQKAAEVGLVKADDEDFRHVAEHEAGHGAVAAALGWSLRFIDAHSGETRVDFPPIQDQSLAERDLEYATIVAAGAVFTGTSTERAELASDRLKLRLRGFTRWEEARALAERLMREPYVMGLHHRLVDALLVHGRLEGPALQRVLEADD